MNKNYNESNWDSKESTYKQIIHFTNGKVNVGYSKRIGFEEVKNTQMLLSNWILRMHRAGYLDSKNKSKSELDCIEYHYRDVKNNGDFQLYFVLYDNYVEWNQNLYRESIDKFLRKYLELKKQGKDPYNLLYTSSKSKRSDPLTLLSPRFKGRADLRAHCERLVERDIRVPGEVKFFYIKYCNQYLNGYNDLDESFISRLHS